MGTTRAPGEPAPIAPPQARVGAYQEQRPMLEAKRMVEGAFALRGEVDHATRGLGVTRDARGWIVLRVTLSPTSADSLRQPLRLPHAISP